jgi:calcium-translocating P-type ATPase
MARVQNMPVSGHDEARSWHALPEAEVLSTLGTTAEGLSSKEAQSRLVRDGPNRLPVTKGPSAFALLAEQVRSPLIYALVASAAVAFAFGEVDDGVVVLAVVVLNTLIGFGQEYRAGRAIAALSELVAEPARVRRDGDWAELPAEEVVPGDLLAVAEGERITADVRLLEAQGLRTQEAALTGESTPVDKQPSAVAASTPLAERRSLLHAGTLVAAGTGHGIAVATGSSTELGRISSLLEQTDVLETPLTHELDRVGRAITLAIGVIAILLGVAAAVRGFSISDAALAGISLAVAAVPEGLPAVVTIALAIGVQRMARRRAIIRHLPAVETLGRTTVVASDKTGTLTQNHLSVESIWTPSGDPRELHLAAVLCNDADPEGEAGAAHGDPTELALVSAAVQSGVDVASERDARPRLGSIPFDAERKFMATLHPNAEGGTTLYVKGAPEVLLPHCRHLDAAPVQREVDRLAEAGQRVLLFAARDDPPVDRLDDAVGDLRLLGLEGLIDPPRPEAFEAVEACRRAGVRVLMVTGDHPRTAVAVARTLGISENGALTGPEIEQLDEESLRPAARRVSVYARAAPRDKLKLVRALQADAEVVAVTGDGVNDAPALRQSALGVAMGRTGTATAKESADMVLADDNFATLRAAIEEGRRVYDNLVKALAFVLPTSVGQALIIAVAVLAFPLTDGEPQLPVEPVQILWINLIVAVALALPLALEAPEPDLMDRPPRRPGTALLDRPLLVRTIAVAITLTVVALGVFELVHDRELADGVSDQLALARAQTAAVTGAVLFQALYLLTCRSLTRPNREIGRWSNPAVYAGILVVLVLQAAFVTLSPMHDLFGSARPDLQALVLAGGASLLVFPVTWVEERWRVRRISKTSQIGATKVRGS